MYLSSFCHGFHEICDIPQYLTQDKIELHLPKPINMDGYKITADRRPCVVSVSNVYCNALHVAAVSTYNLLL